MRLARLDPLSHGCDAMSAAQQIRDWLTETLKREGLTVEKWAQSAGVAKSTIFRALKPDYEFTTSSKTLAKLASVVSSEPPSLTSNVKLAPVALPVRYSVQAGLWFEVDAVEPPEQVEFSVKPHPAYSQFPQWLEKVVGDSVNLKIPAGRYAHVIDAIELGYAPRDGDWVVVERRRDQGAVRERTIKQIDIVDGQVRLIPRSSNPKWVEPIVLTEGVRPGEDVEVEIVGLVVGAYDADF